MKIRQLRRFLGLRLIDVANATGISEQRISLAERNLAELSETEALCITRFLGERLASQQEAEDRAAMPITETTLTSVVN